MKTQVLSYLLAGAVLALSVWYVQGPIPAQADEVPEKYRDTVSKGLDYLAKCQAQDGHWEGQNGEHPVALTALAGMAMLMEGSTGTNKGKYSANITRAAKWLMNKSQPKREGLIFSGHPSETDCYMYGHGLATMFLAWAHGQGWTPRNAFTEEALNRAVKYTASAQSSQGGWYRTSKVEGHDLDEVLSTVIQIQALQTAGNLGIGVVRSTVNDGQQYLQAALAKRELAGKPGPKHIRIVETAAALACRISPDAIAAVEDNQSNNWLKYCQAELAVGKDVRFGRDELAHYYYAQVLFNETLRGSGPRRMGDIRVEPKKEVVPPSPWHYYRAAMFDELQSRQNKDGSWPPGDGICAGPVYATALWCTVLQLDKKTHPLTRRPADFEISF